jgi:uncharacterized protein (TIGR02270 family)
MKLWSLFQRKQKSPFEVLLKRWQPLCIISRGMCCDVGHSAPPAIAAINAHINHFRETRFCDNNADPVVGATLYEVEAQGMERLFQMVRSVLMECLRAFPDLDTRQVAVFLLAAEPERPGMPRKPFNILLSEREDHAEGVKTAGFHEDSRVLEYGKAGIALALAEASALLGEAQKRNKRNDKDDKPPPPTHVLLLGVDSLLDAAYIEHLLGMERLKTPENADGLTPAEGAGAVLLTRNPQTPGLWIEGLGEAQEAWRLEGEAPLRGTGLTQAIRQATAGAKRQIIEHDFHASDMNGESWHAKEVSLALARGMESRKATFPHLFLSSYLGDTGAANAALLLAWLSDVMGRGATGPGERGLLHFASDDGIRAALSVRYGSAPMPDKAARDKGGKSGKGQAAAGETRPPAASAPLPAQWAVAPIAGCLSEIRVVPLVRWHAEDIAFYWRQIDNSREISRLDAERLGMFHARLLAHLEGLAVAGDKGWPCALEPLTRWQKAGEAFACAWLAAITNNASALEQLWAEVNKNPESLLRGVISALGWLPEATARSAITTWSDPETMPPPALVAALRGAALLEGMSAALSQPLSDYLQHKDAHVRAAALRVASHAPEIPESVLQAGLADDELQVRAEAAITLGNRGHSEATAVLQACLAQQAENARAATGWFATQAERRLNRWASHLAWRLAPGSVDLDYFDALLPPRVGLNFALYHADASVLPWLLKKMENSDASRYAGWVFSMLSGVTWADKEGAPEPDEDTILKMPRMERDAFDSGFPLPDPEALRAMTPSFPAGTRILSGQPMTLPHLLAILENANLHQSKRALAAHALRYLAPGFSLNVRAPIICQQARLRQFRDSLKQNGAAKK